ncbi:hypothetical protein AOQ84DRAFT_193818 [Glonium stellatum]|uniref:Uncharacterized protein n=1 Tax=Glonium stellatum TaxID=574774 RepID=A0A8E2F6E8_9PEZI|nr:hypothetical protein AOQ84DRAFT_193818 [Glonium stellatum]
MSVMICVTVQSHVGAVRCLQPYENLVRVMSSSAVEFGGRAGGLQEITRISDVRERLGIKWCVGNIGLLSIRGFY